MNKLILVFAFLGLFLAIFLLAIFSQNYIPKEEAKVIYVQTIFGCVKLGHKYTSAQWKAKKDFDSKYLKTIYQECNLNGN